MTSVSSRPRSQPSFKGAFNASQSNRSPPQAYKTRVIYKNAKVDDNTPNKTSLYTQSYGKDPQANNAPQYGAAKSQKGGEQQKVTLADIRSQPQRPSTSQSNGSQGRGNEGLKSQGGNRTQLKGVNFGAVGVTSPSQGKSQ